MTQNTVIFKSTSVCEHVRKVKKQDFEPYCVMKERAGNGMIKVAAVV